MYRAKVGNAAGFHLVEIKIIEGSCLKPTNFYASSDFGVKIRRVGMHQDKTYWVFVTVFGK